MFSGTFMDKGKDGADLDGKNTKKMETNVRARSGNNGELGDPGAREQSKSDTKNLLGWGEISVGDIGFSVFGTGLRCCDSI
jgi:hypothetical protein